MAIDSAQKRRNVAGNMPIPDGIITAFDRRHAAWNYRGMPIGVGLSGSLSPTSDLTHILTAYRGVSGSIILSGNISRLLTAYRSLGGTTIFTGTSTYILIFVESVGGQLNILGTLSACNPAWILIDKRMKWMGEWDEVWSYDMDDIVLYKRPDGNEWHVFISKIGHNTGNIPTSSAFAWRRLYQESLL